MAAAHVRLGEKRDICAEIDFQDRVRERERKRELIEQKKRGDFN